ncbi:unnamed protein product [Spodoptera littoralis]|uniref:Uncharacterized protein n=1 Tax=Spodoptera littoralis TaxID=7109 RepID=A0A9P0N8S3_SPOLI|nr:unnamed protein product [Spodoptera littoralis]CAH1645650.1 unnamed protein product [Spodoptera littoralis]
MVTSTSLNTWKCLFSMRCLRCESPSFCIHATTSSGLSRFLIELSKEDIMLMICALKLTFAVISASVWMWAKFLKNVFVSGSASKSLKNIRNPFPLEFAFMIAQDFCTLYTSLSDMPDTLFLSSGSPPHHHRFIKSPTPMFSDIERTSLCLTGLRYSFLGFIRCSIQSMVYSFLGRNSYIYLFLTLTHEQRLKDRDRLIV